MAINNINLANVNKRELVIPSFSRDISSLPGFKFTFIGHDSNNDTSESTHDSRNTMSGMDTTCIMYFQMPPQCWLRTECTKNI